MPSAQLVGVTGSRPPFGVPFAPPELAAMQALVDYLGPETCWGSGGCLGVDGLTTRMAARRGLRTRAYLATDTSQTDWRTLRACGTELVQTGGGLLERNKVLTDASVEMHAFGLVLPRLAPRSGTWACARYAQREAKLGSIVVLRRTLTEVSIPLLVMPGSGYCLCPRACRCGLEDLHAARSQLR